jgi:hypothetical protein
MAHQEFTAVVQEMLGDERVIAAGVFGLQDNYAAIAAAGATEGLAMPGSANAVVQGAADVATIEGARQANAAAHGVTERMLVAVTDASIHVFAMSPLGGKVEHRLMSFGRASTDVEIKKFGLSRRVHLRDRGSDRKLELIGTTARFARQSKGDKAVLAELEGHA